MYCPAYVQTTAMHRVRISEATRATPVRKAEGSSLADLPAVRLRARRKRACRWRRRRRWRARWRGVASTMALTDYGDARHCFACGSSPRAWFGATPVGRLACSTPAGSAPSASETLCASSSTSCEGCWYHDLRRRTCPNLPRHSTARCVSSGCGQEAYCALQGRACTPRRARRQRRQGRSLALCSCGPRAMGWCGVRGAQAADQGAP